MTIYFILFEILVSILFRSMCCIIIEIDAHFEIIFCLMVTIINENSRFVRHILIYRCQLNYTITIVVFKNISLAITVFQNELRSLKQLHICTLMGIIYYYKKILLRSRNMI